jgi:hypothetical protein
MRNLFRLSSILLAMTAAAPFASAQSDWKAKVNAELPLLGHRNWILVADSAYPLQVSPGMEVVETDADQFEVVRYVLRQIDNSIHVRPVVFMDAELPFVPDSDAPGAAEYRRQIDDLLRGSGVQSELHEKLIAQLGEAGQSFHVLVLKTNLTIPYSSVFIRLDCKYWPADAEQRLRARMASSPQPAH